MPFPNIDYCLVCEVARAEVGNKLMILGFYGLAPNVDIFVDNLTAPLNLTFVMGIGVADQEQEYGTVLIVTKPDGSTLVQIQPARLQISPTSRGVFVVSILARLPLAGRYGLRVTTNSEVKLETTFAIRARTAQA